MMQVRTDPRVIRDALAIADATNLYQAAKQTGLAHRTIQRWKARRAAMGRPWPTDQDIADWDADHAANAERRKRQAAKSVDYRKRVYLNRGPVTRPSLGTTRRLQALAALGWTSRDLAPRLGVSPARVGHLLNGYWERVLPKTFADVDRVYRELCMTVPQDPPPTRRGEVRVHERQRRYAAKRGWVPPLAWDDIDNPDEKPKRLSVVRRSHADIDPVVVDAILEGRRVQSTRAEKDEAMRRWALGGRGSRAALCRQQGWHEDRYWPVRFAVAPSGETVDLRGVENVAGAWPRPARKAAAA